MDVNDAKTRFETLREYLRQDPGNALLAAECAQAALAADLPAEAVAVLMPLEEAGGLDEEGANLFGTAAMRAGDQPRAQAQFERLLADHPDDAGLRFNLAWSRALAGEYAAALATLDEASAAALPQAAMLDLQLRHQTGAFDEAEARLVAYAERFPEYGPLQAAASVLAMDLDRADLARDYALRAGDHPDAQTTLGMLDLGANRLEAARERFAQSLAHRRDSPRAHLGIGLAELAANRPDAACDHLDRGAEQFGDHLGSWLASGWAHALAGDMRNARSRFERALAIDDTFGEAHGSLAALDAMAGDMDEARRGMEVALRLDRQSFSAALAGMLIAGSEGDPDRAGRIFELASRQPLAEDGTTLAEMLVRSAM